MLTKQQILAALNAWIKQRPGLEFANYGNVPAYRSELRSITRDLSEARQLMLAVELRDRITAQNLLDAFPRAYSGRLQISEVVKQHTAETCPGRPCSTECDHKEFKGARLEYCAGQYWPTEYRKAACAVLSSALWGYARTVMPAATGKTTRTNGPFTTEHDSIEGLTPGDWLRRYFRREFGRGIAQRWFS